MNGQFGIRLETVMEIVKAKTPVSLIFIVLISKYFGVSPDLKYTNHNRKGAE